MQLILLEKVENLGDLGELVQVKSGYARNYLVPAGKAKPATAENIAEFEERRAELQKIAAEKLAVAEARNEQLASLAITLQAKAGAEGKLFGSIGAAEIAAAIAAAGTEVEKREIRLPDGPLRTLGEHEVNIHLHTGIDATVQVTIEAEEQE